MVLAGARKPASHLAAAHFVALSLEEHVELAVPVEEKGVSHCERGMMARCQQVSSTSLGTLSLLKFRLVVAGQGVSNFGRGEEMQAGCYGVGPAAADGTAPASPRPSSS